MKNTEKYKVVNAIVMDFLDFEALINELTDDLLTISVSLHITKTDKAKETKTYWPEDLTKTLSNYFDVKVIDWNVEYNSDDEPIVYINYKLK